MTSSYVFLCEDDPRCSHCDERDEHHDRKELIRLGVEFELDRLREENRIEQLTLYERSEGGDDVMMTS